MMPSIINPQIIIGLLANLIIAGAWWWIAFSLPYHWVLYALAMISTIGALITLVIIVLSQSQSPGQHLILPLSQLRLGVGVLNAALYVVFAAWITSRARTSE